MLIYLCVIFLYFFLYQLFVIVVFLNAIIVSLIEMVVFAIIVFVFAVIDLKNQACSLYIYVVLIYLMCLASCLIWKKKENKQNKCISAMFHLKTGRDYIQKYNEINSKYVCVV